MSEIHFVTMPKWGLAMETGTVNGWLKALGEPVVKGDPLIDVETSKIASHVESPSDGVVRRYVGEIGDELPVGALLVVVADATIAEDAIDAAIAGFVAPAAGDVVDDDPAALQSHTVTIGGRRIRYVQCGSDGDTVVLIHGFGGDVETWQLAFDTLCARARVIALDLPGHGESEKRVVRGDIAEFADTVVGLLDELGIERAHLVGHSLGGAVAVAVAQAAPERVRTVTLVASAGLGSEIDAHYLIGFAAANTRAALRPQLEKLFGDPQLVTRRLIDDVLRYKRLEGVESALARIATSVFPDGTQAWVFREQIDALRVPLQVIWGEDDRIISVAHARNLDGIPTTIVPNAGHMVQLEAPAAVNAAIEAFLAQTPALR